MPMDMEFPSWKPTEIIDAERYTQLKTDILNIFGIPQSFFDLNEANLASAKTGEYGYAKRSQLPAQARIEASLNTQYLPQFGDMAEGFFFAYDNPVPDDEAFQLEMTSTGWEAGVLETDEFRVSVGHEPYGDERGKRRYIASSVTPLDDQGRLLPAPRPATYGDDTDTGGDVGPAAPAALPAKPPKRKPKRPKPGKSTSGVIASLKSAGYSDAEIVRSLSRSAQHEHSEL